ncbi:hypothetical protein MAR_015351 [Mya arenaria]|uniref:Uncharacterized protein n=1 Tax=Mya arenaria TaxID=6604 RepID=A0ABY7FII5_MYAAR|nr:hypothetical protein MAR_015351 [Mya arenaria]
MGKNRKKKKKGLSDAGEPMDNERIGELESTFYERIADEAGATLKDASQDLALMKDQTEKYVGEKVEEGKQSLRKTGKQETKKMAKQAEMLQKEIKDSHGKGHGIYIGHSENTHIGDETTYNIGSTRDDTDEDEDDEGYTKDYPHLSPTTSLNESGDTGARPKTSSSAWKNLPNRVSIDKAESVHIGEKNSPDKIFEESNFFLATNKTEISSASTVNISFKQGLKNGIPTDKPEEIKKFAEAML